MSPSPDTDSTLGVAYWVIVGSLLALGLVSLFSIGRAFWLIAAAMIVLSPFRTRPRLWWSGMALVAGYLIGYAAVAPWGCTSSETFDALAGVAERDPVVCRSVIGVEYTGPDGFEPSVTPGVIAGALLGAVAASAVWLGVGRRMTALPSDTDRLV